VREGALLRVRPKAMTVAVILAGLAPILWGHGAGSEVMSRIAAPMIGGMLTAPCCRCSSSRPATCCCGADEPAPPFPLQLQPRRLADEDPPLTLAVLLAATSLAACGRKTEAPAVPAAPAPVSSMGLRVEAQVAASSILNDRRATRFPGAVRVGRS
jgi:hypothetical protein